MEWRKNLSELADESHPLSISRLAALSDLYGRELEHLRQAWPGIKLERRRAIAKRLAALAQNRVELNFDPVFRLLLADGDVQVRLEAIRGLDECEDPSFIEPLITLLRADSEAKVRAAAAQALGRFTLLAELNKLRPHYSQRLEGVLMEALADPGQPLEVRRRGIEALGPLSSPQVTQAIRGAYHSRERLLRLSAINAMGRNCDRRWLPILLRELSSSDQEMRYQAAAACGELGDEEAIPSLSQALHDNEDRVQAAAISAILRIGGNEAKRVLREFLGPDDPRLRELGGEEDSLSYA